MVLHLRPHFDCVPGGLGLTTSGTPVKVALALPGHVPNGYKVEDFHDGYGC